MLKKQKFSKGIIVKPDNVALEGLEGEIKVDSADSKIKTTLGAASREVITNDQTQTLTNKTIDVDNNTVSNIELDNLKSGVLNTSTTMTGAADTQVPSALAIKTYVDNAVDSKDEADEIAYDNSTSGLTATNVQDAIDEIDVDVDDLNTLSGVAKNEQDLGTFTGSVIPDDQTIKAALQALETAHEDHLNDSSDAHDASAISNTPAGSIAATDVQAAINELDGDIQNHINDVSGAHAASAISNSPSGNLAATDVQAALNELQGDVDARALASDLTTHTGASTDVHGIGAGSDVVGTTTTQTLTNKAIVDPSRLDVKKDTKANLDTYAATAANGQLVFATDEKKMYQVIDTVLVDVGSGSGGVDILFVQDFESAQLTDFTQDGLVLETTDPLKGLTSAKLVSDASDPQFFSQTIPVDEKFRNKNVTFKVNIKSESAPDNVVLTIIDETNSVTLVNAQSLPTSDAIGGEVGTASFDVPEDCEELSYEIRVLAESGSKETIVDDIILEITGVAEYSAVVQDPDLYLLAAGNAGQALTASVTNIPFITVTDNTGGWNGSQFTAPEEGIYTFSGNTTITSGSGGGAVLSYINGTLDRQRSDGAVSTQTVYSFNGEVVLQKGDILSFRLNDSRTLSNTLNTHFVTISKQGSLKVANVNPNSKIKIPTSELRMEGSNSRGAVATAIVRFDSIAKIRGDAFTVTSTANDGTFITMKKAGKLDISASLSLSLAGATLWISINQIVLTTSPAGNGLVVGAAQAYGNTVRVSASGEVFVNVGDIIRISSAQNPSSDGANVLNLSFQEQDIQVSVSNTLPQFSESDSSVRVDTANGYGSTATTTRRFSNVLDNIGTDIEYVDSSTLGAQFIAKSSGIYFISYSEQSTANAENTAVIINKNGVLIAIDRGTLGTAATTAKTACASWQGHLNAGDIITPTVGAAVNSNGNTATFTISKVGKPNVTGVDVTPFVSFAFDAGSVGEIKAFAGAVDTDHFLACEGQAVSRTIFADLFNKIGITHGQGDGSTTFNLPDYRGRFLRGVDGTANRDPDKASRTAMNTGGNTGNNVGSVQGHQLQAHTHSLPAASGRYNDASGALAREGSGTNTGSTGGNETRPINAYVNYGIRFKKANQAIITPTESFSTDTASLTYAGSGTYTLSTLANAPVGTFITFTYAANTNTRTQTTTAPTQTTADMNVNGIRIFTRAYNAASTAASPSVVAIQIGKGLKGTSLNLYNSTGKLVSGDLDFYMRLSEAEVYGARVKSYNEFTGILTVDAGWNHSSVTSARFIYSDLSNSTNGYLVINASKSPALVGVPEVLPRIATIKDAKASGTNGGTATSGAYQTRDLNTLNDPFGIVTSLSSNQFTLPAGEYYIEATSPAYQTDGHKIRLYNVTSSSSQLTGTAEYSPPSAAVNTIASIKDRVSIAVPTTFRIEHRFQTTKTTDGLGVASIFGDSEVYTQVKIQLIRKR